MAKTPQSPLQLAGAFSQYKAPFVYLKQNAEQEEWIRVKDLFVEDLRLGVSPSMTSGTMMRDYGAMMRSGIEGRITRVIPLDISNYMVRIEIFPRIDFAKEGNTIKPKDVDLPEAFYHYGFVVREQNARDGLEVVLPFPEEGDDDDTEKAIQSGIQRWSIVGLEWVLQRQVINRSLVYKTPDFVLDDTKWVEEGLTFNEIRNDISPDSPDEYGNRQDVDRFYPLFAKEIPGKLWNAYEIVKYLIALHNVKQGDGGFLIGPSPLGLSPQSRQALEWYVPYNVVTHNRTIYDVLNQVIDRRRGLMWWCEYDDELGRWQLHVDTVVNESIELNDDDTIPANRNPTDVTLGRIISAQSIVTVIDVARAHDAVVVTGSTIGVVFSQWGVGDDAYLKKDWDQDAVDAYALGAANLDNNTYNALPIDEKERVNDAYRRGPVLRNVYRSIVVEDDWNGERLDGLGGSSNVFFDSKLNDAEFWQPSLRYETYLPLYAGWDYSEDAENPTNIGGKKKSQAEFVEPLVVLPYRARLVEGQEEQVIDAWISSYDKSYYSLTNAITGKPLRFGISTRPHKHSLGFDVNVIGSMQHELASQDDFLNGFFANANAEHSQVPFGYYSQIGDPLEQLIYTGYIKSNARVYGSFPENFGPQDSTRSDILLVDLGERAKLDYMMSNTVVGIAHPGNPNFGRDQFKGLIVNQDGGLLRDDREFLKNIARASWEWYKTERIAISVSFDEISGGLKRGYLLKKWIHVTPDRPNDGDLQPQEEEIMELNSVVTSIRYDFKRGTTSFESNFFELDPKVFANEPPIGR